MARAPIWAAGEIARLTARIGSEPLPDSAPRLLQKAAVPQDLKLLADFRLDVSVPGVEAGQLGLEGVDVVVGEDRIRQRFDAAMVVSARTVCEKNL